MNKSLWQKIQPHAIALGIFFIISCVYCLPVFKGQIVAQYDHEGWKGMAQQSLEFKEKYGHFPLWTNSIFSGMPAFQIAIGSTYNITIAWLHHLFTLFLPSPAGLFFLACLGFYILSMVLRIKNKIAILGSLAYAFASYNAVIVAVGHTSKFSSMGYAPAVLAGLILLTQRKYLLGFITTLVFGTQLFYQNHVQIVYYTLLMAVCIAIVYLIHCIKNKDLVHFAKTAGLAAVAGVLSMLSYAVVLFPTYDYSKETMRGGRSELKQPGEEGNKTKGGLDKDYAFGYSYGITEVLTIAVPRMYGGSSGEMQPGSKTAEVISERTGLDEERADQFAQNIAGYGAGPYWGPQGGTAGAVYFGAIICVLFIFGLIFYSGWNKQWIIAATILGIFLAWGKHFSAFNYFLFDYLPFYNKFRAPSMALVIPQLTFPLLACLGLNEIFDNKFDKEVLWKKFKLASIVSGIFVAVLVILYFMFDYKSDTDNILRERLSTTMVQQMSQNGQANPEQLQQAQDFGRAISNALKEDRKSLYGSDLVRSLVFIALAFGLLYLYAKNNLSRNIVSIGLIALVFIDLIGVDLRYLSSKNYVDKEEFDNVFIPTKADEQILQDKSFFRVFNTSGDPFQQSPETSRTSYLHNSVGGYHPAKLALYNDLIREQLSKGNMNVFNMLNTKYFIVTNPADKQPAAQQNPKALGNAWFVKAVKYVNSADEEMRALDNFSPADTAIIDKREQSKILYPAQYDSTATISLVENVNDKITYKSSSSNNGLAVFSEIYYPHGWKAYIDGKEAPIARVNYVLRALSIPAGKHDIEFRFESRAFTTGNNISMIVGVISILILLYGLFILWKKNRNGQIPASQG
ncbi:MAG: YfhO family protein [Chitinophagaceae bacterium]|nr:YfhO family protein [Chitinophagaceae bacterium]